MSKTTGNNDIISGRASFVVNKPVEMLTPKRLSLLVLLGRGWFTSGGDLFRPSFHLSNSRRETYALNLKHQHWITIRYSSWVQSAAALWKSGGMVETKHIHQCSTREANGISKRGLQLLDEVAPEILRAARAHARALFITEIFKRRRDRVFDAQRAKMCAEFERRQKRGRP